MSRVLVTGANGLIGANLVRELLRLGHEVGALVRESSDTRAIAGLPLALRFGDVTEAGPALEDAMRGCAIVFHAAMPFSYERRRRAELEAAATAGTANVLRAARAAGVGRVVLTSSSVVFGCADVPAVRDETSVPASGDPDSRYAGAKMQQDAGALALARELGLDVVVVCPTLSVGPYGTTLGPSNGAIVAYLFEPMRLTYPGGCNVVSTADVAAGHWLAAKHGKPGEHYILGGENFEWPALHALIAELAGVPPPRVELGPVAAYLAAGVEEWRAPVQRRSPLVTREQAGMVGRYYWYSHAKAEGIGYRPRPARRALAEAISWLAASPHVSRELRAGLRLHDDVYATRRGIAIPG